MNIGDWVSRSALKVPHLVESIVSGDIVTRCGRRMSNEPTKTGGQLVLDPFHRPCRICAGPVT